MISMGELALKLDKKYEQISIDTILIILNEAYKHIDSLEEEEPNPRLWKTDYNK